MLSKITLTLQVLNETGESVVIVGPCIACSKRTKNGLGMPNYIQIAFHVCTWKYPCMQQKVIPSTHGRFVKKKKEEESIMFVCLMHCTVSPCPQKALVSQCKYVGLSHIIAIIQHPSFLQHGKKCLKQFCRSTCDYSHLQQRISYRSTSCSGERGQHVRSLLLHVVRDTE